MSEGLADYEGSSCCHKYDRKKKHKYHHHSDSDSDSSSDSDSDSDDDWAHHKNKNQALSHHVVEEDAASMQNVVAEEKTIVGESVTGKKKIHMVETQAIRNMTGEVKSHPINMMK